MGEKTFVILIVLIFLAGLMFALTLDSEKIFDSTYYSNYNSNVDEYNSEPGYFNEEEISQDFYANENLVNSNKGSSSEESSLEKDLDPSSCLTQISYAISSFSKQKNLEGLNCSLILRNLEYDSSGEFKINLVLLDENFSRKEVVELSSYIEPRNESNFFYNFFETLENDTCKYETISIPTKEIC